MKGLKFVFGVVTLFFGLVLFANLNYFPTQSDLIDEEDFQQEVDLQASVGSNTYASANVGKKPISMDYRNMAYLSSSGYLYAAGWNTYGALGNGRYSGDGLGSVNSSGTYVASTTSYELTPFALKRGAYYNSSTTSATTSFRYPKDYAFGYNHSAVVASDGTLWTAGWNWYGQLGNGTSGSSSDQYTFEQARYDASTYVTDAVSVSMGYRSTLMMNSSGQLYATGGSNYFGTSSATSVTYFTRIDNNTDYFLSEMTSKTVKDFSAGTYSTFILFTDGTLYGCYYGSGFKLIDSGVAMIDSDSYSINCFYLKSDGLYYGQVSNAGVVTKTQRVSMTSTVASTVVQIRYYSTSIYGYLTSSGALYVTDTTYGGAGISTATVTDVAYFDIGSSTYAYVTTSGVFYRWGFGSYGAMGNGSTSSVNFANKISLSIGTTYFPTLSTYPFPPTDISDTPPA